MKLDPKALLKADLHILLTPVNAASAMEEQGFQKIMAPFGALPGALSLRRGEGDELFAWPDPYPDDGYVLGPRLYEHASVIERIREPLPRGMVLSRLARAWSRRWPGEPPPERWSIVASAWDSHTRTIKTLNPGLPHMGVDGWILGAIARRLRQQVRAAPDLRLRISKHGQICMLCAGPEIYATPAFGRWHVEAQCSAAAFAAALPRRMPSQFNLMLEPGILTMGDRQMINLATIECEWAEAVSTR